MVTRATTTVDAAALFRGAIDAIDDVALSLYHRTAVAQHLSEEGVATLKGITSSPIEGGSAMLARHALQPAEDAVGLLGINFRSGAAATESLLTQARHHLLDAVDLLTG
jgi:hypothetical protein